ncbi:MAG: hypothetical protein PHH26_07065 [Candidatus Thermoplasmatota archaeon]|nr:hypothetical protein [Candidatus Thermoplasmatota archaeon]
MAAKDIKEETAELLEQIKDDAKEAVKRVKEDAKDVIKRAREDAQEAVKVAKGEVASVEKKVVHAIEKDPMRSVLIVAGAGLLLGLIIGGAMAHKKHCCCKE